MIKFKNRLCRLMSVFALALGLVYLGSCGVIINNDPLVIDVETMIVAGRNYDLGIENENADFDDLTWTVSDTSILTIDETNMSICGLKEGITVLTARLGTGATSSVIIQVLPPDVYQVNYVRDGGTFFEAPKDEFTVFDQFDLPVLTKENAIFAGWYTSPNSAGQKVTELSAGTSENQTYYARWEYQINYHLNGGNATDLALVYHSHLDVPLMLGEATRLGYDFQGWFDNATLEGEEVISIPVASEGNKNLYASWQATQYEIELFVNDEVYQTLAYTIEDAALVLPELNIKGLEFVAWFDNPEFTGEPVTEVVAGSAGNRRYYAEVYSNEATLKFFVNGVELTELAITYSKDDTITLPGYFVGKTTSDGWFLNADLEGDLWYEVTPEQFGDYEFHANMVAIKIGIEGVDKAYETLAEAMADAKDGDVIYINEAGLYDGAVIDKEVTIVGTNANINPNTSERVDEVVFTSDLLISADNVTINGIALSEGARIFGDANLSIANLTVDCLLVLSTSTIKSSTDAPINLLPSTSAYTRTNFVLINSRYEQASGRHMILYGANFINLTIKNNEFYGSSTTTEYTDGIKLDNSVAGALAVRGEVEISHNNFENYGQYTVWLRSYGPGVYNINYNTYDSCGQITDHMGLMMSALVDLTAGNYEINYQFNTLVNMYGIARIQYQGSVATAENFVCNVNYNTLITDKIPAFYISHNDRSSAKLINAAYNYYGVETPDPAKFAGVYRYEPYYSTAEEVPTEPIIEYILTLAHSGVINIGEESQINYTVIPAGDYEITWSVEDDTVLSIDANGNILGLASGVTKVFATLVGHEGVVAEIEITVNELDIDVTDVLVSNRVDGLGNLAIITHNSVDYYVGINAFATLAEAIEKTVSGIIYVEAGTYDGATINKSITILGANANINPNLETRNEETFFKTDLVVAADNVLINGVALTGAARIIAKDTLTISDLTISYLYVGSGSTLTGNADAVINLAPSSVDYTRTNISLTNSRYEQSSGRRMILYGTNIINLTVTDNEFYGSTATTLYTDGIKLIAITGGTSVSGNVEVSNNIFKDYGQYTVWFNSYGFGTYNIHHNQFYKCGQLDYHPALNMAAPTTAPLSDGGKYEINFIYNYVENTHALVRLQNRGITANGDWTANVNYNILKPTAHATAEYVSNDGSNADGLLLINAQFNYYGGTVTDIRFEGVSLWEPYYLNEEDVPSDSIALQLQFSGQLNVGDRAKMGYIVDPIGEYELDWTSSDENVILIDIDGNMTAVGAGTVTITLTLVGVGVKASLEVTVSEYIVTDTLATKEADLCQPGDKIRYNGRYYIVGIDAFASIAEAISNNVSGTVYVGAGLYEENLTINKAINLVGHNANVDPNKASRKAEALIIGTITIAANNVTINGFEFTGASTIKNSGTRGNFTFIYNNVHDTAAAITAWTEGSYTNGFIVINGTSSTDRTISNTFNYNRFYNVSDVVINTAYSRNIEVNFNVFEKFGRDAFRINAGGINDGVMNFTNNEFIQPNQTTGYNAIYIRVSGNFSTSLDTNDVNILSNYFKNCGNLDSTANNNATVIVGNTYQEYGMNIVIEDNIFETCVNYIKARTNGHRAEYTYSCTIQNNAFLGLPRDFYFANINKGTNDTSVSNPPLAVFGANYYQDNSGNVILDMEEIDHLFEGCLSYGTAKESMEEIAPDVMTQEKLEALLATLLDEASDHVTNNYLFPEVEYVGVKTNWQYLEGQDQTIFELATGIRLKQMLNTSVRTLVVTITYGNFTATAEHDVNFGITAVGETAIFYRQTAASLSRDEPGTATFIGWSGYTLHYNNYVSYIATGQVISVTSKAGITGVTEFSWGSCSLVFHYMGDEAITLTQTEYSKISASYGAVVIRDGKVDQTSKTTFNLQKGDYLYIPQYLDNWNNVSGVNNVILGNSNNYTVGDDIAINYWLGELNPEVYSITYHLDGGENDSRNPKEYSINSLPVILEDAFKENYRFIGWFDNPNFIGEPITMLTLDTDGNIELWALFEEGTPISKYAITFRTNGGILIDPPKLYTNVDENVTILPQPTRDGYRFLGWYETETFDSEPVTEIPLGSTGNKVFYAKWVEIIPQGIYTINYELNGGVWGYITKNEMIVDFLTDYYNYLVGRSIISSAVTVNEFLYGISPDVTATLPIGYGLWSKYTGDAYSGITQVKNYLYQAHGKNIDNEAGYFIQDSRYNAKWMPFFEYMNEMVTAVNAGQSFWGEQAVGSYRMWQFIAKPTAPWTAAANWFTTTSVPDFSPAQNKYATGEIYIELGVPVRDNYAFLGWYDNPYFLGENIAIIGANAVGNKIFYAKWSPLVEENIITVGLDGEYETLEEALTAAEEGATIVLNSGTYDGDYVINKNDITIRGLLGATLTGTITINNAVIGLSIENIKITAEGQIIATDVADLLINQIIVESSTVAEVILITGVAQDLFITNTNAVLANNQTLVKATTINNLVFADNIVEGGLSILSVTTLSGAANISYNDISETVNTPIKVTNTATTFVGLVSNTFTDTYEVMALDNCLTGTETNAEVIVQFNTFIAVSGECMILISNVGVIAETWFASINYNIFDECIATLFVSNKEGEPETLMNASLNYVGAEDGNVAKFVGCIELAISDCYSQLSDVPQQDRKGVVPVAALVVSGNKEEMLQYMTMQLKVTVLPVSASNQLVVFTSSDENIATVSNDGLITAKNVGRVTIAIVSKADFSVNRTITIDIVAPTRIEIYTKNDSTYTNSVFEVGQTIELDAETYFTEDEVNVLWNSSNENVVEVSGEGVVTTVAGGEAIITATIEGTIHYTEVGITVIDNYNEFADVIDAVLKAHQSTVIAKDAIVTGYQFVYNKVVLGSVNLLFFGSTEVTDYFAPITNANRPGTKQKSTEYVTIHDTASSASSGNAAAHASYVAGGGGGTSWHYSTGNDGIYHQIPNDEVAYHAGDGSREYGLDKTNVLATKPISETIVTFNASGYYCINGVETTLRPYTNNGEMVTPDTNIYTTAQINDNGIHIQIIDGYYYLGKTYYNSSFRLISNSGGNRNSIGIETMVNQGSDLFYTWQLTAKHTVRLLLENDLTTDRVRPHQFFSGKNCPQTMRDNGLWKTFLEMVDHEYNIATNFAEYDIEFEALDSTYVDEIGRVVSQPIYTTSVGYRITVSNGTSSTSIVLYSVIPGIYR